MVLGPVPFTRATAGAADQAVLDTWFACPPGLDPVDAAALPMAVETASRGLEDLGVEGGMTVLVHGAGSTVGFAAVQIAIRRGATVVATAGSTYAEELRQLGAEATSYGEGMPDRIRSIVDGPVDLAFDAAPVSGALPDLVRRVSVPDHVLTVSDMVAAEKLGVRTSTGEGVTQRHEVIGTYADLAAAGSFRVPVAGAVALEDWRTAVERSLSGRAKGKLVLTLT